MPHLEELFPKIKANDLLLLVGRDLPQEATGLPSIRELAQGLNAGSLAAAAQTFKERDQPWKYTTYLKQELPAGGEPGPLYKSIAALKLPYIITTTYDDRLARALEIANLFNLLIDDDDVAGREFNRPDLIKLCGDLSRPHTLVVAQDEYIDLLLDDDRQVLLARAREWLQGKTVLLVGCNPAQESDFRNWLYWEVLERLGAFGQKSYLLWANPAEGDVNWWAGKNVQIIDNEPVAFIQALQDRLAGEQVPPPEDKDMAALRGLLGMLRGEATQTQIEEQAQEIPPSQRLKSIRITLRLQLSNEKKLRAALDLKYDPDIEGSTGEFQETGITLQRLRNWAVKAEDGRMAYELPQNSGVEEKGIEFLKAILPPGSVERRAYERALYLRQTFAEALYIVLEPQDDLGRLSPIPWELLHDGTVEMGRGFLGLGYPVYRRMPSVASLGQVAGGIKKALIVAADPTQQLKSLDAEVDWLIETLESAGLQVHKRRPDHPDVSDPEAIKRLLRDGGYQLFHFTGHGLFNQSDPSQSKLVLGRARERGKELTAASLAQVARESELVLVFLSACQVGRTTGQEPARPWEEAGIVDALTRAGVPATLGMRWNVGEQNGRKLAETFYTELLNGKSGKSIERALMIARQAVGDQPDWANPILTKRHGVL